MSVGKGWECQISNTAKLYATGTQLEPQISVTREGDTLLLVCSVCSLLNNTITWTFQSRTGNTLVIANNGQIVDVDKYSLSQNTSAETLTIREITYEDGGYYACTSQNSSLAQAELLVEGE